VSSPDSPNARASFFDGLEPEFLERKVLGDLMPVRVLWWALHPLPREGWALLHDSHVVLSRALLFACGVIRNLSLQMVIVCGDLQAMMLTKHSQHVSLLLTALGFLPL